MAGFEDLADRFVPVAGEHHGPLRGPRLDHDHASLCEGPGLVRGQDRDRPERLDGREPPHDRVSSCHAARAESEAQRHHRRQRLGNGRDRQTDRDHDHSFGRFAAYQPDDEHQRAQRDRRGRQNLAQPGQAELQRSRRHRRVHQHRDPSECALGTCVRHLDHGPPLDHDSARRHLVAAVLSMRAVLGRRNGLTGKHRFVDHQR